MKLQSARDFGQTEGGKDWKSLNIENEIFLGFLKWKEGWQKESGDEKGENKTGREELCIYKGLFISTALSIC